MPEAKFDQEETGFAFTDEDFERRYSPDKLPLVSPPRPSAGRSAKQPSGIHGGGNSFMRARRRRLAASGAN